MLKKQKIIQLDIDELHISTENPRTQIVIDEIEAIHAIIFEQGDKIISLIKSIIERDWMIGDLPAVYYENEKYIVYEGNRRISCLKCFFNPQLLPYKNKTADKFKKYINSFSKEEMKVLRERFRQIPVVLHRDKDTIYEYMELRHTPNNGKGDTLERWNTVANERFKNEIMGKKTLVYAILNEYAPLFSKIEMSQFPITTLERILKNPMARQKMKFEFKNDILIVEDKKTFSDYLKKIIKDIDKKVIDSRRLSKSKDITDYINGNNVKESRAELQQENTENEKSKDIAKKEKQLDIVDAIEVKEENDQMLYKTNEATANKENKLENQNVKITIPKGLLFAYLEVSNVDVNNPDNFGILYLSNELKELSKSGNYKKYPISTVMLTRSLLEQALKYQLKRLGEWDSFVAREKRKNKNNKEPGLESIIDYCHGNSNKIFNGDINAQRYFNLFASNIGTKDYFDMLIHHPECAVADPRIIEKITNNGLYKVIEYIFNNNT